MSTCTPHPPLPLTTPFSLPPSCTATLVLTSYTTTTTLILTSPPPGAPFSSSPPFLSLTSAYQTTDLSAYGLVAGFATSPPGGGPRFHDAGCYPPRYGELRGAWFLDHDGGGDGCGPGVLPTYYSPGVCPAGWVRTGVVVGVRPTVTAGSGGGEEGQGEEEVETTATCCPAAFTVPAGFGGGVVPVYCESVVTAATEAYDVGGGRWTTVDAGTVRAAGVEVRWREGDLAGLLSPGVEGGSASSLSAGAKAGIGLGVGLGGLAMVIGVVGMFLRRRRRVRVVKGKMKEGDMGEEGAEGSEKGFGGPAGVGELEGERRTTELPVDERRVEMDGEGERVAEMDARGREVRRAGAVRKDESQSLKREEKEEVAMEDGRHEREIVAELE